MLTPTETRELQVALSDDELIGRSQKLVSLLDEVDELQEDAKDAAAAVKVDVKTKLTEAKKLRRVVSTGSEERDVLCEWQADPVALTMTLVRVDTGARIETRAMTAEERQGEMFAGRSTLSVVKPEVEGGGDDQGPGDSGGVGVSASVGEAAAGRSRARRRLRRDAGEG